MTITDPQVDDEATWDAATHLLTRKFLRRARQGDLAFFDVISHFGDAVPKGWRVLWAAEVDNELLMRADDPVGGRSHYAHRARIFIDLPQLMYSREGLESYAYSLYCRVRDCMTVARYLSDDETIQGRIFLMVYAAYQESMAGMDSLLACEREHSLREVLEALAAGVPVTMVSAVLDNEIDSSLIASFLHE
jgi:hypothetical protein